jgi:hypothetical protein
MPDSHRFSKGAMVQQIKSRSLLLWVPLPLALSATIIRSSFEKDQIRDKNLKRHGKTVGGNKKP